MSKEMMYLYLKGTEEIIGNVEKNEEGNYVIHDARRLMMVPQNDPETGKQGFGMSMLPFPLVGKDSPITIDSSYIAYTLGPESLADQLKMQYMETVSSIVMPTASEAAIVKNASS